MATRKTAAKTPARTRPKPAAAEDAFGPGDVGKLLQKFKLPGIDIAAIVESQRKDMQALADATAKPTRGSRRLPNAATRSCWRRSRNGRPRCRTRPVAAA